jgi:hypothetical protein
MKEVKIRLDDKSIEILNEINPIHRESIVNFGIRLASETDYFKILKGVENAENLVSINEEKPKKESKKETPKTDMGIDLSDLGGF